MVVTGRHLLTTAPPVSTTRGPQRNCRRVIYCGVAVATSACGGVGFRAVAAAVTDRLHSFTK